MSTAPRYPSYPTPVVPASLAAPAAVESRHEAAWQRLQAGDLDGAAREFQRLLVGVPGFYPAAAGWGFAALAGRDYDQAGDLFERALAADDAYLPAWQGLATTRLEQGREADALRPLERIAALDPSRALELRSRIELLRFHQVQALIEASRRSREAGRLPEATEALE
ncbi:MAG TPA: tetratricopeptide repeat protein, partial [Vicinamibacterales bacterium]|nr:tetratricopeptide repeat protein [Vicinamibacterales bacterium]